VSRLVAIAVVVLTAVGCGTVSVSSDPDGGAGTGGQQAAGSAGTSGSNSAGSSGGAGQGGAGSSGSAGSSTAGSVGQDGGTVDRFTAAGIGVDLVPAHVYVIEAPSAANQGSIVPAVSASGSMIGMSLCQAYGLEVGEGTRMATYVPGRIATAADLEMLAEAQVFRPGEGNGISLTAWEATVPASMTPCQIRQMVGGSVVCWYGGTSMPGPAITCP
jgi:hypothetical protein